MVAFHGGIYSQWAMTPFAGRDAWIELKPLLDEVGFHGPDEEDEITKRLRGQRYSTAEKWMMSVKAWAFNDLTTLKKIQPLDNPSDIKKLGREVKPFDPATWDRIDMAAVTAGSIAKFGVNERMTAELLGTDDLILVEASKHDRIWGVGLDWRDELVYDQANWRGKNKLGRCLMAARAVLRSRQAR